MGERGTPARLALINDHELVVAGLAQMCRGYRDRFDIVHLAAGEPVKDDVDIALYDTFAHSSADSSAVDVLIGNPHVRRTVVYTWRFDKRLIESALRKGVSGYLAKTLPASALVDALERINTGDVIVSPDPGRSRSTVGLDWPGRSEGLTDREAEIIALIAQGKSNAEIADCTFLSKNTIKSYIRTAYQKMGVASRTQAVLWGVEHGFCPK